MTTAPREIFDCERVRAFLDSYLQGQVPPPERRAMRLHIHACAGCHERILERDPLQLFAPLADEERDDAFWAGFWPAVRADIHAAESEARSWRSRLLRPAFAWGAAAAFLLVAALAVVRTWHTAAPPPAIPTGGAAATSLREWHRILPSVGTVGEPTLPTLEDVRSPSARVLSMKVYGADQAVTEMVLIVDEEIKL